MANDVKFIRVNGRVVPVKQKGSVVREKGKTLTKKHVRRKTIEKAESSGMKFGAGIGAGVGAGALLGIGGAGLKASAKILALSATAGALFGTVAGNVSGRIKASKMKALKKQKKGSSV